LNNITGLNEKRNFLFNIVVPFFNCENYIKKYLMKISEKQDDLCIFLLHRIGFIYPNEPIILIAVSANHRGIANKYLQEILEFTKYKVPFWKKEWTFKGSSWVKKNTDLGFEL